MCLFDSPYQLQTYFSQPSLMIITKKSSASESSHRPRSFATSPISIGSAITELYYFELGHWEGKKKLMKSWGKDKLIKYL